jgi:hypothetical protein
MAKLTPDQITLAQSWLHDIFVAGGIYPSPRRVLGVDDYSYMYGNHKYRDAKERTELMTKAKELCEIIKFRKVDTKVFARLDDLLMYFSNKYFLTSLTTDRNWDNVRKSSSMLARYLAWFCSEYEFLWDDSNASVYEKEEIYKTTAGGLLKTFKCYTSQTIPSTRTPRATSAGTNSTAAPASNATPGQPQNSFKSRGALSNVAVDLLSTPNQKEYLSTPIYCVNGVDAAGVVVEDTAYIRPVEADAKSQAKYTINNTNKVLFGKAKGYGYCQVYFTDKQAADDFCMKLIASNPKVNSNIALIKVCQLKSALANGYFKIGTEYGPVYISASKLNESIQEAIQEAATVEKQSACSNKEKWECYEEAYFREM